MEQQSFSFILIAAMIGIVYFLVIRPQNQQRKKHEELIASLVNGDRIILQGGTHGTIKGVDDDTIRVEIAEGVVVVQQRAMVMSITQKAPEKKSSTKKTTAKKAPVKRQLTKTASRPRAAKDAK